VARGADPAKPLGVAVFYEAIFHDNVEKVSYAPAKAR
jgi:hypothetical protein